MIATTVLAFDPSATLHGLAGRSGALDAVLEFVADNAIYSVLLLMVAVWFTRQGLRAGLAMILGSGLAYIVGYVIRTAHPEDRPFVHEHFMPLITHPPDAGFPSDHLLVLGAITAALFFGWRRLGILALLLSAAVAVARVATGVHYVDDVVTGWLIGAACGTIAWFILRPAAGRLLRAHRDMRHRSSR